MKMLHATLWSALVGGLLLAAPVRAADPPLVKVWKTPTCGCCGKWVNHIRNSGFRVDVTDVPDTTPMQQANGLPPRLGSCHTAVVDGYVVEGHVPAAEVRRLLKERPRILGLAAPGMPAGSPGMDVPDSPPWQVLAVGRDGSTAVWSRHSGSSR
jgi:hypothetical protein